MLLDVGFNARLRYLHVSAPFPILSRRFLPCSPLAGWPKFMEPSLRLRFCFNFNPSAF